MTAKRCLRILVRNNASTTIATGTAAAITAATTTTGSEFTPESAVYDNFYSIECATNTTTTTTATGTATVTTTLSQ